MLIGVTIVDGLDDVRGGKYVPEVERLVLPVHLRERSMSIVDNGFVRYALLPFPLLSLLSSNLCAYLLCRRSFVNQVDRCCLMHEG